MSAHREVAHHPVNGQNGVGPALVSPVVASTVVDTRRDAGNVQKLVQANEETWLLIGSVAESMGLLDRALSAYENALRHNPNSIAGLTNVANIARIKENYAQAVDYFQRVLNVQPENGQVWSSIGHCRLMQDDLQKAYSSYQQALYYLPNPKEDPKLWYGIGILYDRYGSLEHAEEAFNSVLRMDKDFEKANEILFRLGIIHKQQAKYRESLECFDRILRSPPSPLAHVDIWFQIGHVYEQQKDYEHAKDAYERVVTDAPNHAKVLQQLGWLYHQPSASFQNQDLAVQYLTKSLEADASDAQSWYLLGRAYMAGQKYSKAYEAYQQAVYRDGRNPTFWCSIGVLYFQINQFRDALDAYSRAIRINPYISEVWFDLGSLYESCNNQISDAMDAYERAAELDPTNPQITQRLALLKQAQATGGTLPAAPVPKDVHPTAYASTNVNNGSANGAAPPMLQPGAGPRGSLFTRSTSRGPAEHMLPNPALVATAPRNSPGPFQSARIAPVNVEDGRRSRHEALAPISLDRAPQRDREREREEAYAAQHTRHAMTPHHPPDQSSPHVQSAARPPARYERPASRGRASPRSLSPPPPGRARSPGAHSYPQRNMLHQNHSSITRSPRYGYDSTAAPPPLSDKPENNWERDLGNEAERYRREPSRDRPGRPEPPSRSSTTGQPLPGYFRQQSPAPSFPYDRERRGSPLPAMRTSPGRSPQETRRRVSGESPHPGQGGPMARHAVPASAQYGWDHRRDSLRSESGSLRSPPLHDAAPRRYDPRLDEPPRRAYPERERAMERERDRLREPLAVAMDYAGPAESRARSPPPEPMRSSRNGPTPPDSASQAATASPPLDGTADARDRRKRTRDVKDKESSPDVQKKDASGNGSSSSKKRKAPLPRKPLKEEPIDIGSKAPSFSPSDRATPMSAPKGNRKEARSPDGVSSRMPTAAWPSPQVRGPPSRTLDEDYDEGVADALIGLASYRAPDAARSSGVSDAHGSGLPPMRLGRQPSPPRHHRSQSTSRPPSDPARSPADSLPTPSAPSMESMSLKRPHSPPVDSADNKRLRIDAARIPSHRSSLAESQPRVSPTAVLDDGRLEDEDRRSSLASLASRARLSPPARSHSSSSHSHSKRAPSEMALPPITTLSPTSPASTAASGAGEEDRMQLDEPGRSPPPRPGSTVTQGSARTRSPAMSVHGDVAQSRTSPRVSPPGSG